MNGRLRLRSLSLTEGESLSVLAQRAKDLPIPLGPQSDEITARLSLEPLPGSEPTGPLAEGLLISLQWSGAQFMVLLSAANNAIIQRRLLDGVPLENLATAWQHALDGLVARWMTDLLQRLGRGPAEVLSLRRVAASDQIPVLAHAFDLCIDFADDAVQVGGHLACDALGLHLMAGLVSDHHSDRPVSRRRQISQTLQLVAGTTLLPLDEFRGLSTGHVIVVQHRHLTEDQTLWLNIGDVNGQQIGFIAKLENFMITLVRGPMENNTISDSDDSVTSADETFDAAVVETPDPDADPIAIDALPIRLSFDLGSVTLPLAEVERLSVGQVLPTQQAVQDYVAIRANGALVGRGVLMEIDGRLAVSVTDITPTRQQGRS